jgi:hypothetical protein
MNLITAIGLLIMGIGIAAIIVQLLILGIQEDIQSQKLTKSNSKIF